MAWLMKSIDTVLRQWDSSVIDADWLSDDKLGQVSQTSTCQHLNQAFVCEESWARSLETELIMGYKQMERWTNLLIFFTVRFVMVTFMVNCNPNLEAYLSVALYPIPCSITHSKLAKIPLLVCWLLALFVNHLIPQNPVIIHTWTLVSIGDMVNIRCSPATYQVSANT